MITPHEKVVCLANALSPVKMQVLDIDAKSTKGKYTGSNYQLQNHVWYDWAIDIVQYWYKLHFKFYIGAVIT